MSTNGEPTRMVRSVRSTTCAERNAPRPNPKSKQAPNGELGTKGASSDQPTSAGSTANTGGARCRRGAGDPASGLQAGASGASRCPIARHTSSCRVARAGTCRPSSATDMGGLAGARERGRAEAPWQEHGR